MRTRRRATRILAHRDGGDALLRDGETVRDGDTVAYVGTGRTQRSHDEGGEGAAWAHPSPPGPASASCRPGPGPSARPAA
ncbi:hypothetical protein, partial [Streptomyces sp. NPDC088135]|uniref:hypothetical protein n=1 Tax=Streptomyces sp. NPDC088135 TaxID=3160993 RepID=UPI00344196CC